MCKVTKTRKTVNRATHKWFPDTKVTFTKSANVYRVRYSSGEISTMTAGEFSNLFTVSK